MRKKSRALLSLVLGLFFFMFAIASTSAQTPTIVNSPSQDAFPPVIWMCPNVTDKGPDMIGRHTYNLKATGLPSEDSSGKVKVYVISGIATENDILLTSGDREIDGTYFVNKKAIEEKLDPLSILQKEYGYQVKHVNFTNPTPVKADGTIDVDIRPSTLNEQSHTFMLMYEVPPSTTGNDDGTVNNQSKDTSGLEYTSFKFYGQPAKCQSFRADPFGRIYNASSLRPIPNATVSLFDFAGKNLYKLPGVPNPIRTREDGEFNFSIEPGSTYLQSNFANDLNVHKNYLLAYTKPYAYGEEIIEANGKQEQRDVPVSGGNTPILKLLDYSQLQFGRETRIEGEASWPLTIVDIMQGGKSIMSQQSDKFGQFSFFVDNAKINPSQQINVRLTEVDLTIDPQVPVQGGKTVEKAIDPIPTYLEGVAYDKAGKPLPFATVQVRIKNNDGLYYETKADGNGLFSIRRRYLPIVSFYLEFIPSNTIPSPANTAKMTIPEFSRKNSDYFEQNNVNIITGTKNGIPVDPYDGYTSGDDNDGSSASNDGNGTTNDESKFGGGLFGKTQQREKAQQAEAVAQAQRQRNILSVIVLFVLLVAVALGLAAYLKQRVIVVDTTPESGEDKALKTYKKKEKKA